MFLKNTEKSPPSLSLLGHSKSGQSSYPSVVELVGNMVVSAVKVVSGGLVVSAFVTPTAKNNTYFSCDALNLPKTNTVLSLLVVNTCFSVNGQFIYLNPNHLK